MDITILYDMLHAGDNLTRALKIEADADFADYSHFLAFKNADGTVFVTAPITLGTDGTAEYMLTADLCPKAGYLEAQLISSDGANEPHVKKSHIYKFYVDPSILIPDGAETPDSRYITIYQLSQRLDALEEDIGDIIAEYLSTHPIAGNNVSFDNTGTDIEADNVQGAIAELAERGGGNVPYIEFYGYSTLDPEDIAHNIEAFDALAELARDKKAFTAVLYTDDNDLAFAGYYGANPTFTYFDATTKTHYAYAVYDNGTVHVVSVATVDPTAKIRPTPPATTTNGDYIGQLCVVNNGAELWVYRGAVGNVNFWERFAKFSDIPTNVSAFANDANYADETYVDTRIAGLGTVFNLKGSKATVADLPVSGNTIGDVWYVIAESVGYIWLNDGTTDRWEQLGLAVDLSAYALKNELTAGLASKEDTTNKVSSISETSTDTEYPSAKATYDLVASALYIDSEATL